MTDRRLRELRRQVRAGEHPQDLIDELRRIVERLVRLGLLPRSFSPYGSWDQEAAEEVFSSWLTERLLARGDLPALLDRAETAAAFRRLCERSLRQHVINSQDRSQARNLYRRLVGLLDAGPPFHMTRDAARPQDRWYYLSRAGTPAPEFAGNERTLIAHAWAIGDLAVIRYRAAARKLSPVLDAGELERFVAELLARVGQALTPTLIMRALSGRLDLGEVRPDSLQEAPPAAAPTARLPAADQQLALRESALAILAELTARQATVLKATAEEQTVAQIAAAAGCSPGTVINEQRRIADLVSRLSENDTERDELLNVLADLIYLMPDE